MNQHEHSENGGSAPPGGFWRSRAGFVLIVFAAVVGLLLVYEHRMHLFSGNALLLGLLAVCVGSHFFMHRGHGGHGGHEGHRDRGRDDGDEP